MRDSAAADNLHALAQGRRIRVRRTTSGTRREGSTTRLGRRYPRRRRDTLSAGTQERKEHGLAPAPLVAPLELTLALTPRARIDVMDVRARAAEQYGPVLDAYERTVYCSLHTTAGYLQQTLASRLSAGPQGIGSYVDVFRALFPEGAGYRHDELDARTDLTADQRPVEPTNGDSHLAFMAGGLRACVSYVNRPGPVFLIDLDGVNGSTPRRRLTTLVGFNREIEVARTRLTVPVSAHPIDAVNLKAQSLGIYAELIDFIARHQVGKGRVRLSLAPGEEQASLTMNEYETLLMRHDLVEVLRDPFRFARETAMNALQDPRTVPVKALGYAKYDFVRAVNRVLDALGLGESRVERLLAAAMAVPASRFFRMKRSISLLLSDTHPSSHHGIVEGTYQSPILVQWTRAPRGVRQVDVTLTRFL
jgi:thiamine phosphate synthase YjbQ (UPF0047 family)